MKKNIEKKVASSSGRGGIVLLTLVGLLVLSSCSGTRKKYVWQSPIAANSANVGGGSSGAPEDFYVIDFKEDGSLLNGGRYLDLVASEVGKERGAIVIPYVHGWTHDSHPGDLNYVNFKKFIIDVRHKRIFGGRTVLGVYFGWPGYKGGEGLKNFANRQGVADAVAHELELFSAITRLSRAAGEQNGHVLLLGHSLGGRIIEQSYLNALKRGRSIPGNQLAVLLNPASSLPTGVELKKKLGSRRKPTVVSLVARDDFANATLYTVAQQIWESDPNGLKEGYDVKHLPAGFVRSFISHYLDPVEEVAFALRNADKVKQEAVERRLRIREKGNLHNLRDKSRRENLAEKRLKEAAPGLDSLLDVIASPTGSSRHALADELIVFARQPRGYMTRQTDGETVRFQSFSSAYSRTSPSVFTSREGWSGYSVVTVGRRIMTGHSTFGHTRNNLFTLDFAELLRELYAIKFGAAGN